MRLERDSNLDFAAEAEAGIAWISGGLRLKRIAIPTIMAILGLVCVGIACSLARDGAVGVQALWWVGLIAIFAPSAASLMFVKVSRTEAVYILLVVGLALYAVKLLYTPGVFIGYDELLHYRTADNILTTGHLFTKNALLPVSPYYPGMEVVTAAIVQLTGLSITQAGFVLIGFARMLSVVAIFLLLERVAVPSRFAAPATLLYMACPSFVFFDSMFAYESLALALALVCLFVLHAAQLEEGSRRHMLNIVGAVLVLAVVVTHHVTSFILAGTLVLWTLVALFNAWRRRRKLGAAASSDERSRRRRMYMSDLPGSGWVPIVGVAAVLIWLFNIAEVAIGYLTPQLVMGFSEVVRIIRMENTGRQLFQSASGISASTLERVVGVGSVVIILALIPFGIRYLWERRHSNVLSHFFAVGALAYPAILVLRFTQAGWDAGSRATAFVYVPLAFALAAGFEPIIARRIRHSRMGALLIVIVASLIFAGGVIAGTSPITRLPSPYNPAAAEVPDDVESLAAANWAAHTLGPGHRVAADSAGGLLIGSIGRQQVVTSEGDVSISRLFLSPEFDVAETKIVKAGHIDYLYVDRRISDARPLKGFIYEPWEQDIVPYGSFATSATVNKFSALRDASKVFDSGNIEFFEVHRLAP